MAKLILENTGMHQEAKPELFDFARHNRDNPTQAEAILWESLRNKKLKGHKFRRQHPIGAYILDFYCHASKLCIEIDGGYHLTKERVEYDKNRTIELRNIGIKEIRFTNEQIINDLNKVLETILQSLIVAPPDATPAPAHPRPLKGSTFIFKSEIKCCSLIEMFTAKRTPPLHIQ